MQISFIGSSLNLTTGGGSNYTLDLAASELARRGHDVSVFTLKPPTVQGNDRRYKIRPLSIDSAGRWGRRQQLVDELRQLEDQSDLFHIYEPSLALSGAQYRKEGGRIPVVVTLNNYQIFCSNIDIMNQECYKSCSVIKRALHRNRGAISKIASLPMLLTEELMLWQDLRFVDMFLPDSHVVVEAYRSAGVALDNVAVIPEMIDFGAFRALAEGRLETDRREKGVFNILYMGRLIRSKGVMLLLEAATRLDPSFRVTFIGRGPYAENLVRSIRDLGLDGRVVVKEWLPNKDVISAYQEADVFVHPGLWPEPFGRTVLEAMIAGTPTITSDVGHPPRLLGEYGLTFRAGDVGDLVRKIVACRSNYREYRQRAARSSVVAARFDYPMVVDQLEGVYRQVLAVAPQELYAVG